MDKKSDGQQPGPSGCQSNSSRNHPLNPLESGVGNDFNQLSINQSTNAKKQNKQSFHYNSSSGEGVRGTLHGTIYQLKLSILFLQTALGQEYQFKLYSEGKVAEKFDDVIFEYDRDGQCRFLQAKHKSNSEKEKITIKKLLSQNSEEPFSLLKYFISFRRIKQRYNAKINDLTICTNADFSDNIKEEIERGCGRFTEKKEPDDILNVGGGKRYKFIFEENEHIVDRLKDATDLKRLAKELTKVVRGGTKLNLKNEIFKAYHVPLVKEVFVKKKYPGSKSKWYCEFKENFKTGDDLSEEANLLRNAFREDDFKIKRKFDASATFGIHNEASDKETRQSLPNDTVTDDEIIEFFEKLTFAVDQPNEKKLGELIEGKILNSLDYLKDYVHAEMIYNYVEKQMLDWLKTPKSIALSEKDDFFLKGAEKVKEIMFSIPEQLYQSSIKEKGINFDEESGEIIKLQGFLKASDKKIFNFVSSEKTLFLSQALVCHVKKQAAWYLRPLLNLKKFSDKTVGNLFQKNLLVIVCKNEVRTERDDIKEMYDALVDCIKDNEKKVVLITQSGSILAGLFKEGRLGNMYEERLDETGVRSLGVEYLQNKLLKKTVMFQGREENLACLIEIDGKKLNDNLEEMCKLEKVVNREVLGEFISDEDIVIGDKLPDFKDSSSPYYDPYYVDIPRKFDSHILREDLLKKCEEGIFAFSSIEENCLIELIPQEEKDNIKSFNNRRSDETFFDEKFYMLDAYNPEESFTELLANTDSGKGVHWITNINSNKLILKYSSKLSHLCEFVRKEPGKDIKDLTDSSVIIAGEPGIGKSTLLTACFRKLELEQTSWFIRVNLKDHQTHMEHATFEDLQGILNFLSKSTKGLETALAKSLLGYRLRHQGQVVLLLDGYDEIKDSNQEKVIRLLKALKDQKGKVWLTTRLNKQREVENALGIFSYFLNPLDEEQQIEFLKQFWISKLHINNSDEGNIIEDFATKLLKYFHELGLITDEENLVAIVLQARMVADIFEDGCRKYLKSEIFNPSRFRINDIFDLYERFIEFQYDRYLTEKMKIGKYSLSRGSKNVLTESYTKAHGCLALKTLYSGDPTCEEFLRDQIFSQDELSGMGLIKNVKDTDTVDFIHRTYAEYFVSKLFVGQLARSEDDPKYKLIRGFLLRNIFLDRSKLIRVFIERGIVRKKGDLNAKWKEIQDCDLLREIIPNRSPNLHIVKDPDVATEVQENSASLEKSLSELKGDVESCMNWEDTGGHYYYNGNTKQINQLFQKFLQVTDVTELETTLEFLVKAEGKSYYGFANKEFSRNNNTRNAIRHYLTQVKLQNKTINGGLKETIISGFETFQQRLTTLKSNQEKLIKFLASESQEELTLWSYLHTEFNFADIKQTIEELYSSKNYYWLERDGIKIVKNCKILTPKMSRQFCSVLDEPIYSGKISGYDKNYASNVMNCIYFIIDIMKYEQLPDVHKPSIMKLIVSFTNFSVQQNMTLDLNFTRLETLLKLIDTLLGEQVPVDLDSANFLFILGEAGLKLLDAGQKILIVHPASEFQYELLSSRDLIVELIDWRRKNRKVDLIESYGEVIFKCGAQKKNASFDESDLQSFSKKRKVSE